MKSSECFSSGPSQRSCGSKVAKGVSHTHSQTGEYMSPTSGTGDVVPKVSWKAAEACFFMTGLECLRRVKERSGQRCFLRCSQQPRLKELRRELEDGHYMVEKRMLSSTGHQHLGDDGTIGRSPKSAVGVRGTGLSLGGKVNRPCHC